MKRILLITAICLAATITVHAQFEKEKTKFQYGLKFGLNNACVVNLDNTSSTKRVYAGVFAQMITVDPLTVEAGLYYSGMGFSGTNDNAISAKTSYIQLPITALYKIGLGKNCVLYPDAGFFLAYGIGGTFTNQAVSENYFTKNRNPFDVGMTLGLNLRCKKIILGVAYDRGFVSVNRNNNYDDSDCFNRALRATVGFIFK